MASERAAQRLQAVVISFQVNEDYTEAVCELGDGSRLAFCHRVGERWAKAVGAVGREQEPGTAGRILQDISLFRLNSRHLEIRFTDTSRWERLFHVELGEQSNERADKRADWPVDPEADLGADDETPGTVE